MNQATLARCKCYLFVALSLVVSVGAAQTNALRAEAPSVKVGDQWKYETRDRRTGQKESEALRTVVSVNASRIEGTENNGAFVATLDMNVLETSRYTNTGEVKYLNFPLEIGKKWSFKYDTISKMSGGKGEWQLDAEVVAFEKTKVQAGEFDTYRIEYKGFWNNRSQRTNGRFVITNWYAPSARTTVKSEFDDGYAKSTTELVEVQLKP